MRKTTLALATLAMLTGTAQAQVYKCTDAAGHVTYSQTRCAETAEQIHVQGSTPRPEDRLSAIRRTEEMEAEVREIRRDRERARLEQKRAILQANLEREKQLAERRAAESKARAREIKRTKPRTPPRRPPPPRPPRPPKPTE